MAEYTENYNLKKPAQEDFYNVEDFNNNADVIDKQLKEIADKSDSALPASDYTAQDILNKLKTVREGVKDIVNDALEGGITNAALKSISDVTLGKSGWTGSSAPYTQVVTVTGVTQNSLLFISPETSSNNISEAADCRVLASSQAENAVTFSAFNAKPSIDLKYIVVNSGEV